MNSTVTEKKRLSLVLTMEEIEADDPVDEVVPFVREEIILDFDKKPECLAKFFMGRFFENHELYTGGPIPRELLHAEHRISKVVNLSIMEALDLAYAAMGTVHQGPVNNKKEVVHEDTKFVVSILHMLAEAKVPQRFSGGMLCLYLELVEGFDF